MKRVFNRIITLILIMVIIFPATLLQNISFGSSDVGDLIVENLKIWFEGEELVSGKVITDEDTFSLSFDWKINNNEEAKKYSCPLTLKNIELIEKTGEVYYDNEQIATFNIIHSTEANATQYDYTFVLELNDEKTKNQSNIGGGALLECVPAVENGKTLPDCSEVEVGFNDKYETVLYRNPGSVSMAKSAGDIQAEGSTAYIDYKIEVTAQDLISNSKISDNLDSNTYLDKNSISVKVMCNDVDVSSEFDSSNISASDNGFTIDIPDINTKENKYVYTITYRAYVNNNIDFSTISSINNDANFAYLDENNEEQSIPKTTTTKVKKPSIKKTGEFLTEVKQIDNQTKYDLIYNKATYNGQTIYIYPIRWTISFDAGTYNKILQDSEEERKNITFNDIVGKVQKSGNDYIQSDNNNSLTKNFDSVEQSYSNLYLSYYLSNKMSGSNNYSSFLTSDINIDNLYTSADDTSYHTKIGADDLINEVSNYLKLSQILPDEYSQEKLTLNDFEYDSNTQKYNLSYIMYMPSYDTHGDEFANHIDAPVFGTTVNGEDTVSYYVPQDLLVKGADFTNIDSYQYSTTSDANSGQNRYSITENIALNEKKESIDYWVALDLSSYKYEYDSNGNKKEISGWSSTVGKISKLTINDKINGGYFKNPIGTIQSTSMGSTISLGDEDIDKIKDSLKIQLFSNFKGFNNDYYKTYKEAEKEFLDYKQKCGDYNNPNPGYTSDKLIELYNIYNTALTKYKSEAGYIGEISYDDLINNGYEVNINNQGEITIELNDLNSIKFYNYSYTPVGQNNGGGPTYTLLQIIGNNYTPVLTYSANLSGYSIRSLNSGTDITSYNGAKLIVENKPDTNTTTYVTSHVNSAVILKKEVDDSPGKIKVSKSSGNIEFKDNKDLKFSTDTSIGWRISVDTSKAVEGKEIQLEDELPEDLEFEAITNDNFVTFMASKNSGFDTIDLATNQINLADYGTDYSTTVENNKIKINFIYTQELKEKLGTNYYINFYFKTNIDNSVFFGEAGKKTFKNTVVPTYNGTSLSPVSASKTINTEKILDKTAIDADGGVSVEPIIDKGNIYAFYRLSVNRYAIDINSNADTYSILDKMTPVMELDKNSIVVKDSNGNTFSQKTDEQEITLNSNLYEMTYENNEIKFTLPDNRYITIEYKVKLNVNPVQDQQWMRLENTANEVSFSGVSSLQSYSTAVNFAKYRANISVWAYKTNGSITLYKYYKNDEMSDVALPGAKFRIYTVYDNNNHKYTEADDEYIFKDNITIPESGEITIDNLPLDRIFKLVETTTPQGFEANPENEYYFLLKGEYNVIIPAELQGKVKEFRDGQEIKYENKKSKEEYVNRKITISKVDENGNPLEGAKLQLLRVGGEEYTWTSTKESYTIENLTPGEYILQELEAPDGYTLAKDIELTIKDDDTDTKITMKDDTTKVKIVKQDVDTKEQIAGAELKLLDKDKNVIDSWTTEKDKSHDLYGVLKAGEKYTLVEEKSPDGYVVAKEISFKVSNDGSVDTIVMDDDYTRVRISKVDSKGNRVMGAVLQVLDGEEVIDEWTTLSYQDHDIINKLVVGKTYILHEKETPAGYDKAEDISFKVNEDGSMKTVTMTDGKVEAENEVVEEAEKEVVKTGDDIVKYFVSLIVSIVILAIVSMKKRRDIKNK